MKRFSGFTLIELLVVITLIGILAVAVLSALNPIEQINKARDAGKRADASQLLTALDRYFASNEEFPWNNFTGNVCGGVTCNSSVDVAFMGTAEMIGVGVCGDTAELADATAFNSEAAGCVEGGSLISTQELKAQFGKRPYFKGDTTVGADELDKLYVYKAANEPSVSVCFIPASKATRDTWDDVDTALKDLTLTAGVPTEVAVCPSTDEPDWTMATGEACFVCIPEE